jgi:hypothetical protein
MNEQTMPAASTLTAASSRRGALRLLAGLALASSGLASFGSPETHAKRSKKSKRKGKKGKRSDRARVPHDGTVVYTQTLEAGKRYRLRISGYLNGSGPLLPSVGVDAGFIFRPGGDPSLAQDVYAGIDFGLSVDGAAASWGPHQTDHVYVREVLGAGKKLALRMVTQSEDNLSQAAQGDPTARRIIEVNPVLTLSGSLSVEVRRL